jgi:regulator of PEP synthase PpsR (kinase-PPPase family)
VVAHHIRTVAEADDLFLVFTSIVNPEVREVLHIDNALVVDFFDTFIGELEAELGQKASLTLGKAHGVGSEEKYDHRIEAVNFSLNHDDGVKLKDLAEADVILVGVSRSGKTPTCLYLALQYGIKAANYPLTPEDLDSPTLPKMLLPYRNKMFGLTIDPARLHHIRQERRPDSKYASLDNCHFEVNEAESMFRFHGVPFISTTHKSIEEIATTIMHKATLPGASNTRAARKTPVAAWWPRATHCVCCLTPAAAPWCDRKHELPHRIRILHLVVAPLLR